MKWIDRAPKSAVPHVVTYTYVTSPTSLRGTAYEPHQLVRTACTGVPTASVSTVLANDVVTTASPTSPVAWCDNDESAPCSTSPNTVSLRISQGSAWPPASSLYTYALTGSIRTQASAPAGVGTSQSVPLLLFGGTGCPAGDATGLSASTSLMQVKGQAFINSGANDPSCPAMRLNTISGYQSAGTSILTPGSCVSSGLLAGPCPAPNPYPDPLPDPYEGLPAPTAPPGSPSGCPGGHASPGVYTDTLAIGASIYTLDSGVYVLQQGMSITTGAVTSGPGGVLIYITGGTFSTALGALVNLSPMTTGRYAGLLLWQDKGDTTPLAMGNLALFALNGTIYAPVAPLNFSNISVNFTIAGIVAKSLVVAKVGLMSVG